MSKPNIRHEITTRKRAEQALRSSEKKYQLLVRRVKDCAILILDPQGRVTTWNEGAERIKGYCAEEIIGQHFSLFYTPEALEAGHPSLELKIASEHGRFEGKAGASAKTARGFGRM
jgi:PAS domain S-box-containing protein